MRERSLVRANVREPAVAWLHGPAEGGQVGIVRQWNHQSIGFRAIDREELNILIGRMRNAVARFVNTTTDWDDRSPEEKAAALEELKAAGVSLLHALAPNPADRSALTDLAREVDFIDILNETRIPWEWLYLGDPDQLCDPSRFLGSTVVLGRAIPKPGQHARTTIATTRNTDGWDRFNQPAPTPLQVRVAEDDSLRSARAGLERDIFASHGVQPDILEPLHRAGDEHKFYEFFNADQHVSHLNCHAKPADDDVPPVLQVTQDFGITYKHLSDPKHLLPEGSIAVLNCCNGMALRFDKEDCIGHVYATRGPAAVVASTGPLEDTYATDFVRKFYDNLLRLASVGQALLRARIDTIRETNNPACLAYSLIGTFNTVVGGTAGAE